MMQIECDLNIFDKISEKRWDEGWTEVYEKVKPELRKHIETLKTCPKLMPDSPKEYKRYVLPIDITHIL